MITRPLMLVVASILIVVSAIAAQDNFKIGKIEFEGLSRLPLDEVIATTNLKTGERFDLAALDAAAQRLVDSGNFKNVAYKTRASKDLITITFVVEETKLVSSSRVIFDNFIWFTDTELIAAIQREIPTFTGMAPDNGDTVERISKALQRFLHEQKIEATVTSMTSQDNPGSSSQEHVFSVNGVPMPICTLHFPGANNVSENKLIESSKTLKGSEYSNKFVSLFAQSNLLPIYRELGQLKAAFSPPLPKPEATATCLGGVDLTIPVDEGHIYKWERAEWSGNRALAGPELDTILDMKAGQPANGLKFDKSIHEIRKAYGRKGFLFPRLNSVPSFDDDNQKVTFKISVNEGSQYRMGHFTAKGFSATETKQLNEKWGLKTGEVFDQGYAEEFSKKQLGEIMRETFLARRASGKPMPDLKWSDSVHRETLTVDVSLELTN